MAEAGCRVQPNLSRFTVASVIRAFTEENRVLELDASAVPYEYIFIDEAGFNLHKIRRRGRNIIGNRAIVNVPGHRGGNITMCAAIGPRGVIHHHAQLGPYNTPRLVSFLDELKNLLNLPQEEEPEQPSYVVIWDNVSFHRAALVNDWFTNNPQFVVLHLPPYSPFLNPIEEFFSAWRWKVYERRPHERVALLQAMEEACDDIHADDSPCKAFFPPLFGEGENCS
ncbi:hypothetical protein SRHO_G00257220 [Serrasalmus rhombeus]